MDGAQERYSRLWICIGDVKDLIEIRGSARPGTIVIAHDEVTAGSTTRSKGDGEDGALGAGDGAQAAGVDD